MTTTDYLESLQEDLNKINNSLNLEEGTNFTDIANMAENGDISTGGGADLSEYISNEINSGSSNLPGYAFSIKKLPPQTFNGTSATYMYSRFQGDVIDLSNVNTENVTDFSDMFFMSRIKELDTLKLKTENGINMSQMFSNCVDLKSLDLSAFNTQNVTNMSGMFNGSRLLENLNLSGFNTSKVSNMESMFYGCNALETIDLSNFNTENVTSFANMFYNCYKFETLDLSSFKAPKVNNMGSMFNNCGKLKYVDLSGIETNTLRNTTYMFYQCKKMEFIDIRGIDLTKITSYSNMFGNTEYVGIPNNCLIIVKDDDSKSWAISKFSRLTNVKTVAEYEAEQSE